jgi:hypothetical protein
MHHFEVELLRRSEESYYPYDPYHSVSYFFGCPEATIAKYFMPRVERLNKLLMNLGIEGRVTPTSYKTSLVTIEIAEQLRQVLSSSELAGVYWDMTKKQNLRALELSKSRILTMEDAQSILNDEDLFLSKIKAGLQLLNPVRAIARQYGLFSDK